MRSLPSLPPSLLPLRTRVPVLDRAVAAPLNWIFPRFAYFLLRPLPLHLRGVSGRADSLLWPLTSRDNGNLAFALPFFGTMDFCDPREWISFWSIPALALTFHASVSYRSSGFFYHDNALPFPPPPSPCFIAASFLTHFRTRYRFAHRTPSRIISRVISHVFPEPIAPPLPSPSCPTCAFALLALHFPVQLSPCARYTEYLLFLEVLRPFHHVCSRVGYYFPIAAQLLAPYMTTVRNSITDSSCDLKPVRLPAPWAINKPGAGNKREKRQ